MPDTINIYEAKTQLSQLVDRAAGGEDVIISRHGKPMARLTKLVEKQPVRFGRLKGKVPPVPDDFDDPMPQEWLDKFYNGPVFPPEQQPPDAAAARHSLADVGGARRRPATAHTL